MGLIDRVTASGLILARALGQAGTQMVGGGLGGGLPDSGISGDLGAAAEMARRMFEQDQINAGGGWAGVSAMFPWISEWRARQIVPLTAGMRLISGVVMQMPLRQFRGDDEVIPPATIVANPAPADNGVLATYVDAYVNDVCLFGNHVCLLGEPDSTGWPADMLPLDVTKVSVARDDRGRKVFTYQDEAPLSVDEVFHVALDRRSGELKGRGLIPTMAQSLQAAMSAEEYAGRYFEESAIPTGVITDSRPDLSQDQADDLKAAWLRTVGGKRRTPIVLPTSTTFTPLVSDADNAQLVQARQWNSQMVAMALGVPPFMLGIETQRHTYTNAENEFGRFIRTTIFRLLSPWEQQFSWQCLPRGNKAAFDERQLLRPEAPARFTMAVQGFAAKLLTQGEARELMGYPSDGGPGIDSEDVGGIDTEQPPATIALLPAPDPTPEPAPQQPLETPA